MKRKRDNVIQMNLKKFKEECIFTKYKNHCFKNANGFRSMLTKYHNDEDIDIDGIYRRIVNYQINKYGESLMAEKRTKFN